MKNDLAKGATDCAKSAVAELKVAVATIADLRSNLAEAMNTAKQQGDAAKKWEAIAEKALAKCADWQALACAAIEQATATAKTNEEYTAAVADAERAKWALSRLNGRVCSDSPVGRDGIQGSTPEAREAERARIRAARR